MGKCFKVCVLMSTYNGSKYILDQVNSILNQRDVEIALYIRDDGSTDGTVDKISSINDLRISVVKGKNIGYQKSFLRLLKNAPLDYDYYAFSDQDDVWLSDKLITAISVIREMDGCAAYCSKPVYVNSILGKLENCSSVIDKLPYGFIRSEWALATCIFGLGCTFVWNCNLQKILCKGKCFDVDFGHDNFLSVISALTGTLVKDKDGKILYRQHEDNVSGNKSEKAGFIIKLKSIVSENNLNYQTRKFILDNFGDCIAEDRKKLLIKSISYRNHIRDKIDILFFHNFTSGMGIREKIKFFFYVMINKY